MKTSKMLRTSPYLIVESMKSKRVQQTRTQLLDTAQANRMQTTARHLGLFDTPLLKDGDTLPPVYHMAYFTPLAAEHELGPDGAERTFNPGEPFTRRMWSGGSMIWNQENPLRLGQEVEEVTTLEKVESKQTRDRKSMIVVTGKKEYTNHGGLCLTDSRKWLFLEPSDAMIVRRQTQPAEVLKGSKLGSVRTTEITLFRYSALTFNSHKIHFDREWCNKIEKHPEIVVHGPLNITLIANAFARVFGRTPRGLQYTALSPVYVNETYTLMYNDQHKMWFVAEDERIIMVAEEC